MVKNQFGKLIWLVDTIYRSGRISFAEINRRWKAGDRERTDIPLRTFHNHRRTIEEMFDINIDCDKRTNTYYISDAEGLFGNRLKMWLLNSFSLNNILQENVDMKSRVVFEEVPAGVSFMEPLIEAMRTNKIVRLEYKAYNWEQSKEALLEPYFLKLFKQRWYLIGVNCEYQAFRAYALDRIQQVELLAKQFKIPASFTPRDYFRDCFGIIRDDAQKPQHTVLRVRSEEVPYLRNLPLHASQKELNATVSYSDFELYISHTYDFIQELLSRGAAVEVLEPRELRDRMKTEIEAMLNLYGSKISRTL